MVFVGKAQAKTPLVLPRGTGEARGPVAPTRGSCVRAAMAKHYYIYAVDRDFFLKFCLPFNGNLCLSGQTCAFTG